jgi:beta-carotene hydroxylase
MRHDSHNADRPLPTLRELGSDLTHTSPWRLVRTLAAPAAAAAAYFAFAMRGEWTPAVISVIVLSFVSYGSTSHDLVHRSLPIPARLNDLLLSAIEMMCLRSGRAYRLSHLHHHRRFPHEDDVEASVAGRPLVEALLRGPSHQLRLWLWAWRRDRPSRPRLAIEAAWFFAVVLAGVVLSPWTPVLLAYCALVIGGSWLIPLVTVSLPHDPRGETPLEQTRAFRGLFFDVLGFAHLYHLEHHLYPSVPHHHWRRLARRLDPVLRGAGVKVVRVF